MKIKEGEFQRLIYYIYGFLVLWEWLRPLAEITDTEDLSVFFYFIALCFLLAILQLPFIVTFSAKILFISHYVNSLFFDGGFFAWEWLGQFFQDVGANIGFILATNWWEMTYSFRTTLFFVLLWLIVYLMEYWIVQLKKILFFLILTITYIAILDTFTPYHDDLAIVRMVVFGFLILGLLKFERLKEQEKINVTKKLRTKWVVPLIVLIVCSTTVGYVAPKAAPIWPDPIPFLKGYGDGNGIGGVKKIGYGTNDTRLGGAFIGDETVVFMAETKTREYWRVETKDVYTGKGWEVSNVDIMTLNEGEDVFVPMVESSVETTPLEAKITVKLGYPHIVYPVELAGVRSEVDIEYKVNLNTEKIITERNGEPYSLDSYEIMFNDPRYFFENLRLATVLDNGRILERYTQLPDNMPNRVRDLAEEIIAPYSNRYDQVKAVESYFRRSGFAYETNEVAVPEKNEDYVDQFLFETMKGYCDNFSTSMAVLLRSVGIPARWVKGYTGGEYVKTLENNTRLYEIKNANAHSWVEVYFPGSGWVPFEPTMGFSNPYEFKSNEEKEDITLPVPNINQDKPDRPDEDLLNNEDQGKAAGKSSSWLLNFSIKGLLKVIGLLLVLSAIAFSTRRNWYPFYIKKRYGKFKDSHSFEKAYFVLLDALKGYGLKKKDNQTLREYAFYVDSFFSSKEMRKLTVKLEGIQYRRDRELDQRDLIKVRELWENLINKASP